MKNRRLWMVLAAAALIVAWYLFRPESLWLNNVVAESLEEAVSPATIDTDADMPVALLQGSFRSVHHEGAGTATVYRLDDGSRLLRLTDFATENGPDLYVYLIASNDAPDNATVERAGYISLGRLKGNQGDQNYVIPTEVDLSRYRAVSIWCRRFGVNFAVAALGDLTDPAQRLDRKRTTSSRN
jgi:hypothetical protein